ncbi:MAG: DUF3108 domain-containing protein [Bacteroidaceae bacterium]|nr:DUF3108 domain-containing protein [Bacteroidaceae bacterium]
MRKLTTLLLLCLALATNAWSQTPTENKAIKVGEDLTYDLYFNWKFIWVKVGKAYMNTTATNYKNQKALKTYLITRGNEKADKFFVMRDTLTSISTNNLVPLYYQKSAEEGKRYTVDKVWYNYSGGKTNCDLWYKNRHGEVKTGKHSTAKEVYDMISMLNRARSWDAKNLKPGQKIKFLMAEGKHVEEQTVIYRKKEVIKANNDVKYNCHTLSFVEYDEKGKENEIVTFYVTDDDNHLPVRLDLNLKFGSAKAYLVTAKNYKHPMKSVVK